MTRAASEPMKLLPVLMAEKEMLENASSKLALTQLEALFGYLKVCASDNTALVVMMSIASIVCMLSIPPVLSISRLCVTVSLYMLTASLAECLGCALSFFHQL